jgi:hypothetical protein
LAFAKLILEDDNSKHQTIKLFEEAIDILSDKKVAKEFPRTPEISMINYAKLLRSIGKLEDADNLARTSIQLRVKRLSGKHHDTIKMTKK